MTGRAYFVRNPSSIEYLWRLHLPIDRARYVIVGIVSLPRIEYENFITDMVVTRDFLEAHAPFCRAQRDGTAPVHTGSAVRPEGRCAGATRR